MTRSYRLKRREYVTRVPKYVAPLKLLDDVIRDLDESSCSNKKAEAMQFLRAAKEILEAEGR